MATLINKTKEVGLNKSDEEASETLPAVANGLFVLALTVVLVLNLLGNSMVFYVVYQHWKTVKQRVTHSLIANLAAADILVAIAVLLSIIKATRVKHGLSYTICQVDGFLSTLVGTSSITIMAVIAIDRYLVIVLNHRHRLKLRAAWIMMAGVWTLAIFASLLPILFWGKYHNTKKSTQCKPDDGGFLIMLTILFFLIPLVTMIFCYVSVFLKVRRHKQIISGSLKERQGSFKTEFKTTKIVFTVLATFIILWTPYVVVYVPSTSSGEDSSIPPGVFKFCGFLTAMHSMCNPIIYLRMNRNFRRTAIKLLRRIFARVLPVNEDWATSESACAQKANSSLNMETLHPQRNTLPLAVDASRKAELSNDLKM